MKIELTPSDVKAEKILEPGWYKFQLEHTEDKASSSGDGSMVAHMRWLGLSGAAEGVPVRCYLSEKSKSLVKSLIEALQGTKVGEEGIVTEVTNENARGRTVEAFIKNGLYEGRTQNVINDFRAVKE